MKFYKKSLKGFTLIELLVVIAIIAMLSTIIIGPIQSARKKARDAKRSSELNSLKTALELYLDENGSYPESSGAWRSQCAIYGSYANNAVIPGLVPNYLPKLPTDPLTPDGSSGNPNNCYLYLGGVTPYNGYKVLIYNSTEPPSTSSTYYDPVRPGNSWMICSGGASCNTW